MINMKDVCEHPEKFALKLNTGQTLKFSNKFILPMAGTDGSYLLDTGEHRFPAYQIKVDEETGECLAKSVDEWVQVGTIVRVP